MSAFTIPEQLALLTLKSGENTSLSNFYHSVGFQLAVAAGFCYELRLAQALCLHPTGQVQIDAAKAGHDPLLATVAAHLGAREKSLAKPKKPGARLKKLVQEVQATPKLYRELLQGLAAKGALSLAEHRFMGLHAGYTYTLAPGVQRNLQDSLEQLVWEAQAPEPRLLFTLRLLLAAKLLGRAFAHRPAEGRQALQAQAELLFRERGLGAVLAQLLREHEEVQRSRDLDDLFDALASLLDAGLDGGADGGDSGGDGGGGDGGGGGGD
jgi:hypothetical protein